MAWLTVTSGIGAWYGSGSNCRMIPIGIQVDCSTGERPENNRATSDRFSGSEKVPKKQVDAAYETFKRADIRPSAAGTGFTGTPIVAPDEQNKKIGEMSWNDIETMLSGFAYDVYCNRNETSKKNYFTVFDYAIDQDLPLVAVWETNHHYGYQIRKIYTTAWLMRDESL